MYKDQFEDEEENEEEDDSRRSLAGAFLSNKTQCSLLPQRRNIHRAAVIDV